MSDKSINVLFPVGRMVQGSLYTANTTNAEGKPLLYKTGPNAGQPRPDYYFAVAIPKSPGATHFAHEPWGKAIYDFAHLSWPAGQAQRADFAWKITDGDSQVPNKVGKRPCDQVGHAGHWVVRLSSSHAPKICTADGKAAIIEPNAVKCGDYVEVFALVKSNESTQTAGMHINHQIVAHSGYGEAIVTGPDAASVGFGGALPPGASTVPLAAMTAPPVPAAAPAPVAPPIPTPAPNTAFVNAAIAAPPPPVVAPAAPARVMLPPAGGATYEAMIAAGWTDATLVQHGMMAP